MRLRTKRLRNCGSRNTTLTRTHSFAGAVVSIHGTLSTDPNFYRPFAET